jgi:membrane protease YdiL (CAAX protease family)
MNLSTLVTPANVIAALLALIPFLSAAFFPEQVAAGVRRLPAGFQLACPVLLCLPYILVCCSAGVFYWGWLALYAALPVAVALLLWQAAQSPSAQRGTWQDFLVLAVLGLSVDLRWFESAWPPHLAIFNKVLLLDAGIYGFIVLRNLDGVGFDLRLRWRDAAIGLREVIFYTPIALALGLSLGFLHLHAVLPGPASITGAWLFTFFFIAVPEELYFRGWLQNLLERRIGRTGALLLTSVLFGLAHFNKRAVHFNWRYVLLAAIAGFFYGRAWRRDRRVGASAVTHASVDTIWSLWLK